MAVLYSRVLARATSFSGGPTIVYSVPAGFIAVVRTMSIVTGSNFGAQDAYIARHAAEKIMWIALTGVSAIATAVENGRWVFLPGDQLVFATNGGLTADFYVSGYELSEP